MLDVKNNYRGKYENNICRMCGVEEETQDHVLNTCKIIHECETLRTPTSDLFENNIAKLRQEDKNKLERINNLEKIVSK